MLRAAAAVLLSSAGAIGVIAWSGVAGSAEAPVVISTAPAEVLAFDPSSMQVPDAASIPVEFRNASSLPHNLVFVGEAHGRSAAIVEPGATDALVVRVPGPGSYAFVCTIHAGMRGMLVVGDPGGAASR